MPEEQQVQQEESTIVPTENDLLQQAVWGEKPVVQEQVQPETKPEEKKPEPQAAQNEWWKEFQWETPDAAKNEITELRKLKEQKPEEIKFANDQSKILFDYLKEGKEDEAFELIAKKKAIEKVTAGEVTESNAADILKLSIKNKYKEFSDDDVERKFSKQYGVPKEPVYDENKETETDFQARHSEWQEKVKDIKADMVLDAKVAKPELESLKSQLVLPDISKNNAAAHQPTQEELAAEKKIKDAWVEMASVSANSFEGFSTKATFRDGDKDIEIPVSYGLSPEEKTTLIGKLNDFANSNFDPYTILKERWVNADGNDNIAQVVKDLSWLFYGEKAAQKFANDASAQRLELYLKGIKNIKIDGGAANDFSQDDKPEAQKLQEWAWSN